MQELSLYEARFVSGADQFTEVSNAYLSGLKGEEHNYLLDLSIGIGSGGTLGAILGLPLGPEGSLLGAIFLGMIGGVVSYAFSYNEYLYGRNYAEAQKIINSL